MMGQVARALVIHELVERLRDRWVIIISALFGLLAAGVSAYGSLEGQNAEVIIGPSLVTLSSLLVPLVAMSLGYDAIVGEREQNTLGLLLAMPVGRAEVVAAKFVGRSIALWIAICLGLGVAWCVVEGGARSAVAALVMPTLLLGGAFLSAGMLISSLTRRQSTATSVVVVVWFISAFLYDLAIIGLLVWTDGNISSDTATTLVIVNPSGLYRLEMMMEFGSADTLQALSLDGSLMEPLTRALIWAAWIILPASLSGWSLHRAKGGL